MLGVVDMAMPWRCMSAIARYSTVGVVPPTPYPQACLIEAPRVLCQGFAIRVSMHP